MAHLPLTLVEAKLVTDISKSYGYALKPEQIALVVSGLLAGSMLIRIGVTEMLTFVPTIGWMIKGTVAAGAIKALGSAAIKYFEDLRKKERALASGKQS